MATLADIQLLRLFRKFDANNGTEYSTSWYGKAVVNQLVCADGSDDFIADLAAATGGDIAL